MNRNIQMIDIPQRRDKREKIVEDFKYFFDQVLQLPGDDTELQEGDITHILASAASLVVANETRKLETVVFHGIKDLLSTMNPGTQTV